jgi:ABC-type glycerol-3-phosphate transport system substrate-binding protein/tRNA A-37 threonylcarbamoyl transferase component Bud32
MVYRAYQPSIGREVAIKVIRPELANDPVFIRRFETETNLIAGLESNNVVPIYDFWREPDAAFLVEKLITGGNLGGLLAGGPITSDRVVAIVDQVTGPLALAHELGVVHGGLRPETVLLDKDGNAHLTDFGIAIETGGSVATDIRDLSTLTAELLAGIRGTVPELVVRLEPHVAGVLADANESRFSTVREFVEALRSATGGVEGLTERQVDASNPFKGLEPFDEADTGQFFGRERLLERMLARLGGVQSVNRFLAVVGPSGSGKSSVVNAGLIPALRAGGVAGSDNWFVVTMTPGVHPFESLVQALTKVAVGTSPLLLEQMLAEPSGLRRSVDTILPDHGSPLVLVVDQFEELYTIAAENERATFTEALVEAITHPRSRLRVVITLRADFYDHPLASPGLGELLREHTELVTPMNASELELAITHPADAVGVVVQPALLAALTADALSESGVLPMLQYSLTELFERRHGATMTAAAYESMGGLTGAVVERAEALFGVLGPEARAAARHVFLRLVSVNEGGEDTRRRVLLSELQALEGRDDDLDDMLRAFARHRLLTFDRDPASRGPTVEIAHEALIGAWERLASWLDEARDDLRAQRRLASAAADWADQEQNPDFLLAGASLARYATWHAHPPVRLTPDEKAFLDAALEQEHKRERAARDRLLHESQLRRRTRALVGLGAMSLLVVLLAVFAFNQRQTARNLASESLASDRARQLVTESGLVINEDPDLAVLLAIEAIRATESGGEALPEAIDALHWALQAGTIEYPATDAELPLAVRPHGGGPRGVFALSPAELVDLGRDAVRRGFSSSECERYFLQGDCPVSSAPIGSDLEIAGGIDSYTNRVRGDASLAGTRVVVTGQWIDTEADAVMSALAIIGDSLGIDVVYRALSPIEASATIAAGDDPGDVVILAQPGAIAEIAAQRPMVDVGRYLDVEYLRDSYGDYLTSLGSLNGHLYGVFVKVDAKSLVWYNREMFAGEGYVEPSTWEGLVALSDQMVNESHTPWCLGVWAGEATGWPATDWLETIILRSQGPEFYDRWASHQIPFDDPAVVAALEKVGVLAHSPGYVFPGPGFIADRSMEESIFLASQEDPQCWLFPGAGWAPAYFVEGAPMVAIPFPAIDPAFASSMVGGGDLVIAVSDRPEVRAVIRGLTSPEWGVSWAESGVPFIPAHGGFDLEAYTDPVGRSITVAVQNAIEAGMYRFDASDQMPFEIAFQTLHSALTEYVTDPDASAAEVLSSVEMAWTEYEADNSDG